MACKCSPSLKRLMADFASRGHVDSGCCGDAAHQARKSDHNPDSFGYAHAQDVHELADHDMQPYVDFIMANPALFPQVKYLIYEGHIYYPHDGARKAGRYVYTGLNDHAHHLHVSIFADFTHYGGDWHVAEAYDPHTQEEDEVKPYVVQVAELHCYVVQADAIFWLASKEAIGNFTKAFGAAIQIDVETFERIKRALNSDVTAGTPAA